MEISQSGLDVGELIQIEVESLNHSAHAVGKIDGLVVFVSGGVPGDKLMARITQIKKNYVIAEAVDILSASPHRCHPPCVHFIEGCGGCQWQHVAYEHQIQWKKDIVRQALKRIGKLNVIPEIEITGIDSPLHYRNKLRLFPCKSPSPEVFASESPFLKGGFRGISKDGTQLGMRKAGSHEVVPIRECLISDPAINSLKPVFCGELFSPDSGLSELSIRSSDKYQQIMLSCTYNWDDPAIADDIDRLSRLPGVTSVFYRIAPASGRRGRFVLGYGDHTISEEIRGIEYRIGPGCFFQINIVGLKALIELIREFAGRDNQVVLDAHCGVGTFVLQMADVSDVVWGTDISSSAVTLARLNAADDGISNVHFRSGTASQVLRDDLRDVPIDIAILDPPRRGCEKTDLQSLIGSRPGKVIYVSCDPTTLARDIHGLRNAGYRLLRLAMVDMFPMTYHLEVVALCVCAD